MLADEKDGTLKSLTTNPSSSPRRKYPARLIEPTNTDKNYLKKGKGGYNSCLLISGKSCLPNCFSSETKVITSDGIFELKELEGLTKKVLTEDGQFREAKFKSYGEQELYKITFSNNQSVFATANHRWIIYIEGNESNRIVKLTYELEIDDEYKIPYVNYIDENNNKFITIKSIERTNRFEKVYCCEEPVTHTMVLDGHILTGQCVGYAWGRWRELLGESPKLTTSGASKWYAYTKDGYKRSPDTPNLGAVMCWGRKNITSGHGHVAIVEKIEHKKNGDIWVTTSESSYGGSRWSSYVRKKSNNWSFKGYNTNWQGFILFPETFSGETAVTNAVGGEMVDDEGGIVDTSESTYSNGWLKQADGTYISLVTGLTYTSSVQKGTVASAIEKMIEERTQSLADASNSTGESGVKDDGTNKYISAVYEDVMNNADDTYSEESNQNSYQAGNIVEFNTNTCFYYNEYEDALKKDETKKILVNDKLKRYYWKIEDEKNGIVKLGWNNTGQIKLDKWTYTSNVSKKLSSLLDKKYIVKTITNKKGAITVAVTNDIGIDTGIILKKGTKVKVVAGTYSNGVVQIKADATVELKAKADELKTDFVFINASDYAKSTESESET